MLEVLRGREAECRHQQADVKSRRNVMHGVRAFSILACQHVLISTCHLPFTLFCSKYVIQ